MFRLQGPFPAYQTTVVMPSEEFGNTNGLKSSVQTMRTMDNTLYTFVKPKRGRRGYQWDFVVSKEKALEVKAFVDLYLSKLIKAIDHNGDEYIGHLTMNPLELSGEGRAGGWPGGEAYRCSLILEERV